MRRFAKLDGRQFLSDISLASPEAGSGGAASWRKEPPVVLAFRPQCLKKQLEK
jgi:hypothetical protein